VKTTLLVVGGIILAGVLIVALMVFGFGIDMFGLELGKHLENQRTGVTRQTNQYVTTQQGLLSQYAIEYEGAVAGGNNAQAQAIVGQMKRVAGTIDAEYVPVEAAKIIAAN
jgi:hypothetical protein